MFSSFALALLREIHLETNQKLRTLLRNSHLLEAGLSSISDKVPKEKYESLQKLVEERITFTQEWIKQNETEM